MLGLSRIPRTMTPTASCTSPAPRGPISRPSRLMAPSLIMSLSFLWVLLAGLSLRPAELGNHPHHPLRTHSVRMSGRANMRTRRSRMPDTRDEIFATRLRGHRIAAGLSQEELAQKAGLSANAVGQLERGDRKHPYPHTVISLADGLGLYEQERSALLALAARRGAPSPTPTAPALPVSLTPLVGRERDLLA